MASNALEKSLRSLEAFQSDQATLTVKEIASLTGDAVSSVQRSVFTLEALGYLERELGGNRYVLGRSCLRPAYGYLRGNRFLELSSPHLIKLSERLNTRCDLTVLDGNEIVYLARFPSKDEAFVLSPVGRRWP
ncbi:MAG: helix-turn-helix domain-containing protein, partial [Sulfitobacter sp.]